MFNNKISPQKYNLPNNCAHGVCNAVTQLQKSKHLKLWKGYHELPKGKHRKINVKHSIIQMRYAFILMEIKMENENQKSAIQVLLQNCVWKNELNIGRRNWRAETKRQNTSDVEIRSNKINTGELDQTFSRQVWWEFVKNSKCIT